MTGYPFGAEVVRTTRPDGKGGLVSTGEESWTFPNQVKVLKTADTRTIEYPHGIRTEHDSLTGTNKLTILDRTSNTYVEEKDFFSQGNPAKSGDIWLHCIPSFLQQQDSFAKQGTQVINVRHEGKEIFKHTDRGFSRELAAAGTSEIRPNGHLTIHHAVPQNNVESIKLGIDGSCKYSLSGGFEVHQDPDGSTKRFKVSETNGRREPVSIGSTPPEPAFEPPPPVLGRSPF